MSVVRQVVTTIICGVLVLLALTGCRAEGPGGESTVLPPRLRIGVPFDEPGLGLKAGTTHEGFDIEVASYVAHYLGYSDGAVTWKEAPLGQRENLLLGRQVDLVVASFSMTDARRERVGFAGPYLEAAPGLLVGATSTISALEDLAGKRVCTASGTTSAQVIAHGARGARVSEFDNYADCVQALGNGSVDAVAADDAILAGFAARTRAPNRMRLVRLSSGSENYGVGMRRDETDLCRRVSAALTSMVTTGEWGRAAARTLGRTGYHVPAPPTSIACR